MAVMSLIATAMLVQVSHLIKLGLMVLVVTATGAVNIYSWRDIYDLYDYIRFASYRWEMGGTDQQALYLRNFNEHQCYPQWLSCIMTNIKIDTAEPLFLIHLFLFFIKTYIAHNAI